MALHARKGSWAFEKRAPGLSFLSSWLQVNLSLLMSASSFQRHEFGSRSLALFTALGVLGHQG